LKAFQDACEEYGYVGYFRDWIQTLYLRDPSSLSGANPSIHYNLSNGLTICRPKEDIEDVRNHILVWGGTDVGFPPTDLWTEDGVSRFPNAWVSGNAHTTISDVVSG